VANSENALVHERNQQARLQADLILSQKTIRQAYLFL